MSLDSTILSGLSISAADYFKLNEANGSGGVINSVASRSNGTYNGSISYQQTGDIYGESNGGHCVYLNNIAGAGKYIDYGTSSRQWSDWIDGNGLTVVANIQDLRPNSTDYGWNCNVLSVRGLSDRGFRIECWDSTQDTRLLIIITDDAGHYYYHIYSLSPRDATSPGYNNNEISKRPVWMMVHMKGPSTIKLYLDGFLQTAASTGGSGTVGTTSATGVNAITGPWLYSANNGGVGDGNTHIYFHGKIQRVAAFNGELTQSDFVSIMRNATRTDATGKLYRVGVEFDLTDSTYLLNDQGGNVTAENERIRTLRDTAGVVDATAEDDPTITTFQFDFDSAVDQGDNGNPWTNPGNAVVENGSVAQFHSATDSNALLFTLNDIYQFNALRGRKLVALRLYGTIYASASDEASIIVGEGNFGFDGSESVAITETNPNTEWTLRERSDFSGYPDADDLGKILNMFADGISVDLRVQVNNGSPTVYVDSLRLEIDTVLCAAPTFVESTSTGTSETDFDNTYQSSGSVAIHRQGFSFTGAPDIYGKFVTLCGVVRMSNPFILGVTTQTIASFGRVSLAIKGDVAKCSMSFSDGSSSGSIYPDDVGTVYPKARAAPGVMTCAVVSSINSSGAMTNGVYKAMTGFAGQYQRASGSSGNVGGTISGSGDLFAGRIRQVVACMCPIPSSVLTEWHQSVMSDLSIPTTPLVSSLLSGDSITSQNFSFRNHGWQWGLPYKWDYGNPSVGGDFIAATIKEDGSGAGNQTDRITATSAATAWINQSATLRIGIGLCGNNDCLSNCPVIYSGSGRPPKGALKGDWKSQRATLVAAGCNKIAAVGPHASIPNTRNSYVSYLQSIVGSSSGSDELIDAVSVLGSIDVSRDSNLTHPTDAGMAEMYDSIWSDIYLALVSPGTPTVTNATTDEDVQTSSGLVCDKAVGDVTTAYFKLTVAPSHGTLYKNDGTTAISSGSFFTLSEGQAGLKYTPSSGYSGTDTFTIKSSTDNEGTLLSVSGATSTITINSLGPDPTVDSYGFRQIGNVLLSVGLRTDGVVEGINGNMVDAGYSLSSYPIVIGGLPLTLYENAAGRRAIAVVFEEDVETNDSLSTTVIHGIRYAVRHNNYRYTLGVIKDSDTTSDERTMIWHGAEIGLGDSYQMDLYETSLGSVDEERTFSLGGTPMLARRSGTRWYLVVHQVA